MFFERLRRASTVRRAEPAEPTSPGAASSPAEWLRRLRPARATPAPAPDGVRRATSERTRERPVRLSTTSAPPAVAAAASTSTADAHDHDLAVPASESTRRPVYRRASASMPALAGVSELPLALVVPAAAAPLAAFLAAGLDAASLRTGPAARARTLVHPSACFAECAVEVEEWPAASTSASSSSCAADEDDADLETVVDTDEAALPPARVHSLPRSAGSASRIGRARKRARAGSVLRPLSVESVRRHASKRRRGRHRSAAATSRSGSLPASRIAAVRRLRARRGRRPRFATRAEA